jgi:hypothetical protein
MHALIGFHLHAQNSAVLRRNRSTAFILACTINVGFACTDLIYSFSMPCNAAENSFYSSSFSPGVSQLNYPDAGGYNIQPSSLGISASYGMNQTPQTQQAAQQQQQQQQSLWDQLQQYQNSAAPVQMQRPAIPTSEIWQANQNQTPNNRWRATFGVPVPATIKYDSGSKFSEL